MYNCRMYYRIGKPIFFVISIPFQIKNKIIIYGVDEEHLIDSAQLGGTAGDGH